MSYNNMMKKALIILILIIAVAAIVWHRAARGDTIHNSFCPSISELQKNPIKGNWTAETKQGLWKSHSMSFATNITQFVGAQWVGENIGQITCVYNAEQEFTMQGQIKIQHALPVLLVFHTLALQPTEKKWKRIKQGVYNCYSISQSDCLFEIKIKPPVGNIYQEAESLKSDHDHSILNQPTNY